MLCTIHPFIKQQALTAYKSKCMMFTLPRYLMADYTIICYDSVWLPYGIVGGIALLVYPIGIPSLYLMLLYRSKDVVQDTEHPEHQVVKNKIGFLFQACHDRGTAPCRVCVGMLIYTHSDDIYTQRRRPYQG